MEIEIYKGDAPCKNLFFGREYVLQYSVKIAANNSLKWSAPLFRFSCTGLFKDREPQETSALNAKRMSDYFVLSIKAEVFMWQKRLSTFIEVDNLFGKNYRDLLGVQMPGRWIMGRRGMKFFFTSQHPLHE